MTSSLEKRKGGLGLRYDKQTAVRMLSGTAASLLEWYDTNARKLPWRENTDPYRVWLSEIMLQQTRVEAVKGYYIRFLQALPDISALAQVEEDVLLKLWEGLGYYNRARNLQRAARQIIEQYGGKMPSSYEGLLALPGIGEYTAGAIASISFGVPVPAVDGNVLRVLARLLDDDSDIASPVIRQAFRGVVQELIPPDRPGDFNQALMELGAVVCIPNGTPLCEECPLAHLCMARQEGHERLLPVKAAKKERRVERRTIVWVTAEQKLLLFRRGKGLLSGMYEPLNREGALDKKAVQAWLEELGAEAEELQPLGKAVHRFSHVEWQMVGYAVRAKRFHVEAGYWATAEELAAGYAIPSAFRAYTKVLPELFTEKLSEQER